MSHNIVISPCLYPKDDLTYCGPTGPSVGRRRVQIPDDIIRYRKVTCNKDDINVVNFVTVESFHNLAITYLRF